MSPYAIAALLLVSTLAAAFASYFLKLAAHDKRGRSMFVTPPASPLTAPVDLSAPTAPSASPLSAPTTPVAAATSSTPAALSAPAASSSLTAPPAPAAPSAPFAPASPTAPVDLTTPAAPIAPAMPVAPDSLVSLALRILTNRNLYIGGALYVFSALCGIALLRALPYIVAVPLGAVCYIWTLIISRLLLHERVGAGKIAGVALIILGLALVVL